MENNREQVFTDLASTVSAWHVACSPETSERGGLSVIRLSSNLRTQVTADGGVVLDLHRGKMFRLNPAGATILELLVHGSSEKQIIEEICRKFGEEAEPATTDVRAFLASLVKHQLLERESAD